MKSWRRVKIPGPNNTTIYILAKPEHERSFNVLLRQDVERRRPILEQLIEERREAAEVISAISMPKQGDLFGSSDSSSSQYNDWEEYLRLNKEKLERLSFWLTEEEARR